MNLKQHNVNVYFMNNYKDNCIADYNEDVMEEGQCHHCHVDSVYNSILRINQTKQYREVDNAKKQHEQEQIKIGKKNKRRREKNIKKFCL